MQVGAFPKASQRPQEPIRGAASGLSSIEASKNQGPFCWSSHNKDSSILESIVGNPEYIDAPESYN